MGTTSRTWVFAAVLVSLLACERGGDPQAGAPRHPEASPPPAVELGPQLSAVFRLIGRQQNEAARQDLAAYLQRHPDDGKAEFLLALSYHREKRYGLARPHFARAIELEPDYHPAYHFQGWCLYWLGELPAAREAFERHLSYLPDEGDSHFAIGLIDLDEDRLDDAQRRFEHAIVLQSGSQHRRKDVAKAHARIADIPLPRDELADAKARLQAATGLWPEHYTAFYKLHRVLTRLGEAEAAAEAFRLYRRYEQQVREQRGVPEPGS